MRVDPRDFTPQALSKIAPHCGCCADGGDVDIAQGHMIYPNRPDLWAYDDGGERWWWYCGKCGGYVGCNRDTLKPLGTPADKPTRDARSAAHAVFDPMWRARAARSGITLKAAKARGTKWLAGELGVDAKGFQIGNLTAEQARRVVEICKAARS